MKKLGLIGGMSWESSAEYYRIINQTVHEKLGRPHSCECIMYSFDFGVIDKLQHEGKWNELSALLVDAALNLERSGAEFLLLCTNTMHILADDIEKKIAVPLLHIADAIGKEILKNKMKKVGLLGTKFTMEKEFYKERLRRLFGIEIIIPVPEERERIHSVIYNELINGIISNESRNEFITIINNLRTGGAEGVILGCTEIPLIVHQDDCRIQLFDSTRIHSVAAVELALTRDYS
ncbi:MAG: aspartate/glutamate racemase family protein [Bacteroidales bacterium]|nr:MAG: aspartate/glutamate racemase family protein [Bacteroidales bacterium]